MTTVVLVDDHALLRLGLIEAIESDGNMEIVADVPTCAEAVEAYHRHKPDVMVMDFRLPDGDGAETTKTIIEQHPEARILILSAFEGEEDIWRAVEAGAKGYLTKGADTPTLLDAINSIAGDSTYFPAKITRKIEKRKTRTQLSGREREILEYLGQGLSNKEICATTSLTIGTVKFHLSRIFEKLGVADRTQAVVVAVQRGLLHLDG